MLDNGQNLICTKDHRILCRNGDYVEAQNSLGCSLMPFAYEDRTMYGKRDYTYVYNPNDDGSISGIYPHRVVSIEDVEGSEVYDLKLDKIHNFALTCGLFVHNCGALWNASQHQEEYAYEYGEDLMSSIPQLNSPTDSDAQRFQDEFERQLSEQHRSNMIQQQ